MADNVENSKTRRDMMLERLKSRYPEREFTDDESMYDQIGTDYDEYENQLKGYSDREQEFIDLFTKNPEAAGFLMSMKDGKDPIVMLVEMFGEDLGDMVKDPERMEQVAEAHKRYLERVTNEQNYARNWTEGMKQTLKNKAAVKEKHELSDAEIDQVMQWLFDTIDDCCVNGVISQEAIELALKAVRHDIDVDEASREGEVRGKNTKIQEQLRSAQRGDNVPNLGGGTEGPGAEGQDLGAIGRTGGLDIFERGGERRKRRR